MLKRKGTQKDGQNASTAYERKKERSRRREASLSHSGREIGPLPEPKDPGRRAEGLASFERFCKIYLVDQFPLPWSSFHLRAIEKIEDSILTGRSYAMAFPRGSGKSTICRAGVIWGRAKGAGVASLIISATDTKATDELRIIKTTLTTNKLLAEDFPEMVHPLRALKGVRQKRLLLNGEPILMNFGSNEIQLPWIEGAASAGGVIAAYGLTSEGLRGISWGLPDGRIVRPYQIMLDDPQTDESARSAEQTKYRMGLLRGLIGGMAGPGERLSVLVPCTVIAHGDLSQQLLDRRQNPEFRGEMAQLINSWPNRMDLWNGPYKEIYDTDDRAAMNAFYLEHQEEMDAGGAVSWEERKSRDEVSGLQSAIHTMFRTKEKFGPEYQNQPEESTAAASLDPEKLVRQLSGLLRGTVPNDAAVLTGFVDVHKELLYWVVVAWYQGFGGTVADYGTFPPQQRSHFTLANASPNLSEMYPALTADQRILQALGTLLPWMAFRPWQRTSTERGDLKARRILVDANWHFSKDLVFSVASRPELQGKVYPSHGTGLKEGRIPYSQWKETPTDHVGHEWVIRSGGDRTEPRVLFDANYYKTFLASRLTTRPGDPGAITFFGDSPALHGLFAEHCAAEFPSPSKGQARRCDEWAVKTGRPDNHWWDCLVGATVAASIEGIRAPGWAAQAEPQVIRMPS